MSESDSKQILAKLDTIMRLVALQLVEGKARHEQCLLLSKAGWQPKEIAELLGTTGNTVSVTLSQIRNSKKPAHKAESRKA